MIFDQTQIAALDKSDFQCISFVFLNKITELMFSTISQSSLYNFWAMRIIRFFVEVLQISLYPMYPKLTPHIGIADRVRVGGHGAMFSEL